MTEPDWEAAARSGDVVAAIKLYRLAAGVNLADAKHAVEAWADAHLPAPPGYDAAMRTCERIDARLVEYLAAGGRSVAYTIGITGGPDRSCGLYKLVTALESTGLDLAVEVVIPGTSISGRRTVIKGHLTSGVRMVWYLDAEDVSIRVATEMTQSWIYHDEAVFTGGDVLPGFSCKVADLFA